MEAVKMVKVWFSGDYLFAEDEQGKQYKQSLLWYPRLRSATDEEREAYTIDYFGISWRGLDEDVSFESFTYEVQEPTPLQRFFLTHKEINVAGFAKRVGLDATLLRNYINGYKQPSIERERMILEHINALGRELASLTL